MPPPKKLKMGGDLKRDAPCPSSRVPQISSIITRFKMSAVISDAAFEWDMRALHMRLGELCHYGQWHKEEPTMPLLQMIRIMTKLREEAEVEATKRAMEDWAWEEEEAIRKEEAQKAWISCEFCAKVQRHDVCDICRSTLGRFEALGCEACSASYKGCMTGDWDNPCSACHPFYIQEYRYAEEQRVRADAEEATWLAEQEAAAFRSHRASWAHVMAELVG